MISVRAWECYIGGEGWVARPLGCRDGRGTPASPRPSTEAVEDQWRGERTETTVLLRNVRALVTHAENAFSSLCIACGTVNKMPRTTSQMLERITPQSLFDGRSKGKKRLPRHQQHGKEIPRSAVVCRVWGSEKNLEPGDEKFPASSGISRVAAHLDGGCRAAGATGLCGF